MKPLFVRLGLKSQQYHDGMRKARDDTKRLKKNTDSLSSSFKAMKRIAVASFAGFGISKLNNLMKTAIRTANEQEKATAKLTSVIESTGHAAGFTTQQLQKYADQLQSITSYGDEVIESGMAILATFKNIKGETFERVTKSMLNLSELLGTDLRSSAIMLGKALNDPLSNLGALSRSGIQFTKVQKDMIKELIEQNKLFEAQNIILEELESEFGNVAEDIRNTFGGATRAAANAWGDVVEQIGFAITKSESMIRMMDEIERVALSISKAFERRREGQGLEYYDKQISNLTRQIINLKTAAEEAPKSFTDYWYKIVGEPSNIERTIAALEKQRAELEKQRDVYKSIGTFRQKIINIPPPTILSEKDARAVDNALAKWFADLEKIDDQYYKIQEVSEQSIQEFHIDEVLGKWFSGLDNIEDQYYQIEAAQESLKEFSIDKSLDEWFKGLDEIEDQYYQIKIAQESLKEFSIDRSLDEWFKGLDESEKKAEENAKEIESIYETFLRNIQNSFADVFEDIFSGQVKSWEDYLDTVKKMFIRMLAEMAAAALTKKITAYVTTEQQPGSSGANIGYFGGTSGAGGVWTGALAGTAVGSQQQSPLGGAVSGALAGYAMGGGYGAIAGAILGAIAANQSNDQSAAYTYEMGENWVSGFFGDIYNQGMFIPQYGYAGKEPLLNGGLGGGALVEAAMSGLKGGTIAGEQIQNQLVDAANEIIYQYQQILQSIPDQLSQQIQAAVANVNEQWAGSYEMSPAQLIQYFTDQYNQTLMAEIGPRLAKYVKSTEAYGLLGEYAQGEILAPFYTAPGETTPFATAEDALKALQYLEQVQKAWQDISLASQGLAGDSIAYEQGINNINNAFDQMVNTLQQLGIATEKIDEVEVQRQEALIHYAVEMKKKVHSIRDQWKILSGGMTEYKQQLMELFNQYQASQQAMIDAGASQEELNELSDMYGQALINVTIQMKKAINDTLDQWEILSGGLTDYEQQLMQLQIQYESAIQTMTDAEATQAELNELTSLYGQAIANLNIQMKKVINDTLNQWKIMSGGLTEYKQQLMQLQIQYESAIQTMVDAGASQAELNELTSLYNIAIFNLNIQMKKIINDTLDQWEMLSGNLTEYEQQLMSLENQYESAIQTMVDAGASQGQLNELTNMYAQAIANLNIQMEEAVDNILNQWISLSGGLTDYEQQLMNLENQYLAAQQAMIDAGASQGELNDLTDMYNQAITSLNVQMETQINNILNQWLSLSGGLSDLEQQLMSLENQYESAMQAMIDAGATQAELSELAVLYQQTINNIYQQSINSMIDAWDQFYNHMMGDLAPVQSAESMGYQLTQMLINGSIEELMNYITSEYMPFMQQYGASDYNTLWSSIMTLISNLSNSETGMFSNFTTGIPAAFYYTQYDPNIFKETSGSNNLNKNIPLIPSSINDNKTQITIQIGNNTVDQFILESLKNDNSEIVREIRRIAAV